MEYKAKNRKFTLIEQEKIGDALKVKKAKYETDNNEPRRKISALTENKRKWESPFTQTGFIKLFVRAYFVDLKNENSDFKVSKSVAKISIAWEVYKFLGRVN